MEKSRTRRCAQPKRAPANLKRPWQSGTWLSSGSCTSTPPSAPNSLVSTAIAWIPWHGNPITSTPSCAKRQYGPPPLPSTTNKSRYLTTQALVWYDCCGSHVRAALWWEASWEGRAFCCGALSWGAVYPTYFRRAASVGFGRTSRGRGFVYHAGTAMDGVGGAWALRGGMVSWPHSLHTPCSA